MQLEEMSSFFNARVDDYDEHMMKCVDGADRYYIETAKLIPLRKNLNLLDLGCGTGLEFNEIFARNDKIKVTGIDLAEDMLNKLKEKYSDRLEQINLICEDYFECELEEDYFDVALTVQTLHHFTYDKKVELYKKIYSSLKKDAFYIETDYMAPTQEYENFYFLENKRIRTEMGITNGFYHYDTPCTVENQIKMLKEADFNTVDIIWQHKNTTILLARK